MLKKNDAYAKAVDSIEFSTDIKERVMLEVVKRNKKNKILRSLAAVSVVCFALGAVLFASRANKAEQSESGMELAEIITEGVPFEGDGDGESMGIPSNGAIELSENCNIIIDISVLGDWQKIEGVYLYNCATGQIVRFDVSGRIEYHNEVAGAYLVFAMTQDGEGIDLSQNVTIEYISEEGNGFIGL